MTDRKDANELRCIAHEIILDLHRAREQGQIELLLMACMLAHKSLDREAHKTWCQNALDTMKTAEEWEAKQALARLDSTPLPPDFRVIAQGLAEALVKSAELLARSITDTEISQLDANETWAAATKAISAYNSAAHPDSTK